MAQSWAKPFYHSPAWLSNRKRYINALVDTSGEIVVRVGDGYERRDGTPVSPSSVIPPGMCERCFRMGRVTAAKVVHHKDHLTPDNVDDPKVTLAYDNLERLCQDCHAYVHSGQTEPRVTFDEHGNIVPPDPESEFLAELERLTSTESQRRNIHRGR